MLCECTEAFQFFPFKPPASPSVIKTEQRKPQGLYRVHRMSCIAQKSFSQHWAWVTCLFPQALGKADKSCSRLENPSLLASLLLFEQFAAAVNSAGIDSVTVAHQGTSCRKTLQANVLPVLSSCGLPTPNPLLLPSFWAHRVLAWAPGHAESYRDAWGCAWGMLGAVGCCTHLGAALQPAHSIMRFLLNCPNLGALSPKDCRCERTSLGFMSR